MKITQNKVVHMHYTLTDGDGHTIDSSSGREPLAYIQGMGNIIPGLEKELEGKVVGDQVKAIILPADGYGERDEKLIQIVPKSGFRGDDDLRVGMQVRVQSNQGQRIAAVTRISGEDVTLDMNHPLAGVVLHFDVEIQAVREATKDELDHGHVHGPGGHHH